MAKVILRDGQVTELRALDATTRDDRRLVTISGYFDDAEKLADAVELITGAKGIYFIPNPVKPALLGRSVNKARAVGKDPTTSDTDIVSRQWLLIDCDPVRPAGIASSDEEHEAALARLETIVAWLTSRGFALPIVAGSGNGAHAMYRVDLPTEDGGLIERVLDVLAQRFDDAIVKVDTSVHNPARIWKLYGTLAGKGDAEAAAIGRPHRMAKIITLPDELIVVTREQLEAIPGPDPDQAGEAVTKDNPRSPSGSTFNIADWIRQHSLDVTEPEPWQGSGQRWVFKVCPWNSDHTNGSAYIVRWPNGKLGAGCHHDSCKSKDWHALRDLVEPGWRETRSAADHQKQRHHRDDDGDNSPVLVNLAIVSPRAVQWLWPDRIALGKLTLLAGEPGLGKSFLTMDLTARVTKGSCWPDGSLGLNAPGSVVLLSAEDDVADTIRPRLDAAGADVGRVTAMQGIEYRPAKTGPAKQRCFSLEKDLPALEIAVRQNADCKLVIIDPVSAYLGGTDSHKNAEIRGLLAPLADLASRHGAAVVVVTHLNKATGSKAMHRITGSGAFIAAARAGWLVALDRENPKRRLLLPVKNNLAEDIGGLAYSIIDGAVAWETGSVSMTADDALGDNPRKDGQTERDDAVSWLRELLNDGPMPQRDVAEAAKANGISAATLRRAKVKAGVRPRKEGFQKDARWIWALPANRSPEDAEDAQSPDVNTFDTFAGDEQLHTPDQQDEVAEWRA